MSVLMACLSIFVFLAPRVVPGPGQCYISAPCLQSGLISVILFILFAQRALFQAGKKKKKKSLQPSLVPLGGCWSRKPKKTQGTESL